MKNNCRVGLMLLVATTFSFSLCGQNYFFAEAKESAISTGEGKRVIIPEKYKSVVLDTRAMETFLNTLPSEPGLAGRAQAPVIELPMPGGGTAKYRLWQSPVMEPALAARFPAIKTFAGQGIDDPTATVKIDFTELGFHAMVLSDVTGNIFIDTYRQLDTKNYIVYYKKDLKNKGPFIELGVIPSSELPPVTANRPVPGPCVGTQIHSYRLAVACTGEYAQAVAGNNATVAQALAAITTSINRVDGIYEKELAVSLNLVANNNLIVFVNPTTDPFTENDNGNELLAESQTVINANIGAANYDIGHTFSTGGGGIAQLGVVCGNSKARGVTGLPEPTGDAFDIDFVAHEMGHQFNANHTFNATTGNCGGNRNANTAVEPGSGITIMSYSGICGATNDLADHSIANFHAVSMDEINVFTASGSGSSCGTLSATGNIIPIVNAANDFTIPKSTTFVLTGSATDANGDALTYSWEEVDDGPAGNWNNPTGNAALFRPFEPVTSPVRFFPKLSDQIANTTTIGEILPSYGRTMVFRLTTRDNRAGGGGVCFDEATLTVDANSGPFVVTVPSASGIVWDTASVQTVTWDRANTNNAPVNCANVSIQLSIDGGLSFPITILASTPNDGSEQITVPANITTQARIRVMAVGNVFYDMSNNNFAIVAPVPGFNFIATADKQIPCADPGTSSASITLATVSVLGNMDPITFSASGNPAGTAVSFSPAIITPGESTTVTLNNVNSLSNASYTITVTGVSTAITRTQALIFVVQPGVGPVITTQPADEQVCEQGISVFNVAAASAAVSYQWQLSTNSGASFSNIAGAAASSFTVTDADPGQNNQQYRCLVTGQCNVTASGAAVLTVHPVPTVSLTAAPVTSLTPGLTTVLTLASSAPAGAAVATTWFKDEIAINVPGTTLIVDVTALGTYQVQAEQAWADGNVCVGESQVVAITATASSSLFIYPNPNDGRFTLSYFNAAGANTSQSVTVYDSRGAKVYRKIFTLLGNYELLDIDLRGRARGIYFIVVGDAAGKKIAEGKVVVH